MIFLISSGGLFRGMVVSASCELFLFLRISPSALLTSADHYYETVSYQHWNPFSLLSLSGIASRTSSFWKEIKV